MAAAIERDEGGDPAAKPDAACQPKRSNGEKPLALEWSPGVDWPLADPLTYIVLKTRATTEGCNGVESGPVWLTGDAFAFTDEGCADDTVECDVPQRPCWCVAVPGEMTCIEFSPSDCGDDASARPAFSAGVASAVA